MTPIPPASPAPTQEALPAPPFLHSRHPVMQHISPARQPRRILNRVELSTSFHAHCRPGPGPHPLAGTDSKGPNRSFCFYPPPSEYTPPSTAISKMLTFVAQRGYNELWSKPPPLPHACAAHTLSGSSAVPRLVPVPWDFFLPLFLAFPSCTA